MILLRSDIVRISQLITSLHCKSTVQYKHSTVQVQTCSEMTDYENAEGELLLSGFCTKVIDTWANNL